MLEGLNEPIVSRIRATCEEMSTSYSSEFSDAVEAVSLPMRVAVAATAAESAYEDPTGLLFELVRFLQRQDQSAKKLFAQAESKDSEGEKGWRLHDGALYKGNALYIPGDKAVTAQVIRMHHDNPLAGHFGKAKTFELIARKYCWEGMRNDIDEYVKSCAVCQKTKTRRHRPYGELAALPCPDRAWQEISMDFITDLPPSKRNACVYDAILVIVDRYSKMNRYIPTTKTCTAADLAVILRDEVVSRFGLPKGIVSDRGSLFTSEFWSEFCYETRVKRKLSTAFHPQTDGQTERANQTLEQYLRCYCTEYQDNWAEFLPQAEFAVNNSEHAALRMSPFCVVYGFNPDLITTPAPARDELLEERVPVATEIAKRLKEVHETLTERWRTASGQQAKYYNQNHDRKSYRVGDQVLLSTKNLRLQVPKKKLAARFIGPFQIRDAVGPQAYRLALPPRMRIHNVFHVSLLEPWTGREGEEHEESMPLADED